MHELSVCQSMLSQVEAVARQHKAEKVCAIHIAIGVLSGVEPDLLRQAYSIARSGTIAATAELVVETLPARIHCDDCNRDSDATPSRLVCAHCGNWQTRLVAGDELMLNRIELSLPDDDNQPGETPCATPAAAM